jgi:hypothetical protein
MKTKVEPRQTEGNGYPAKLLIRMKMRTKSGYESGKNTGKREIREREGIKRGEWLWEACWFCSPGSISTGVPPPSRSPEGGESVGVAGGEEGGWW